MSSLFGGSGPSAGEMEAMRMREEERLAARREEEERVAKEREAVKKESDAERSKRARMIRDSLLGRMEEEDEPIL